MPLNLTPEQIAAANSPDVTTFFLYEIYYTDTEALRYTNWSEPYVLNGYVYTPNAIKHGQITQSTDGKINDLTLSVGNADRVIQGFIEEYDLMRRKVKIIQVFKDIPGGISATFKIKKARCKKDIATITLSIGLDVLKSELPGRKILSKFCWWVFKDQDCRYAGADADCERSIEDCRKKGNLQRFGGFPGVVNERIYF